MIKTYRREYSIIISSCDKYSDIWTPFFTLFFKYYKGRTDHLFLVTETKKYDDNRVNTVNVNSQSWGKRILQSIEIIDSKYILLLLDDFFIRDIVDVATIEQLILEMENESKIGAFYFQHLLDEFSNQVTSSNFNNFSKAKIYTNYKHNLQAALWRTECLKTCIKDFYSPWDFELFGSRLGIFSSWQFYFLNKENKRVINYRTNERAWGIVQGKWVIDDVKPIFDDSRIIVNFEERGLFENIPQNNKSAVSHYFDFIRRYVQWLIKH